MEEASESWFESFNNSTITVFARRWACAAKLSCLADIRWMQCVDNELPSQQLNKACSTKLYFFRILVFRDRANIRAGIVNNSLSHMYRVRRILRGASWLRENFYHYESHAPTKQFVKRKNFVTQKMFRDKKELKLNISTDYYYLI